MQVKVEFNGLDEVKEALRDAVRAAGSGVKASKQLKLSGSLISLVLNSKTPPPPALLRKLGFKREVVRHYRYTKRRG